MRSGKRFVAAVSLAVFTLTTPLRADEAKTDQPGEENEIEFLRQEVKNLNERLARLEGLLTQMALKAESAGSTVTEHALAPGEARLINANLPAATPEPSATPEPAPQAASFEAPEGIASTGGSRSPLRASSTPITRTTSTTPRTAPTPFTTRTRTPADSGSIRRSWRSRPRAKARSVFDRTSGSVRAPASSVRDWSPAGWKTSFIFSKPTVITNGTTAPSSTWVCSEP